MRHLATAGSLSRRQWLQRAACGFGSVALLDILSRSSTASAAQSAQRPPHHPPRARHVIFLFMQGGPSHVDTFDYKPKLAAEHGELKRFDDPRTRAKTGRVIEHQVMKSPWKFRRYGESGTWVSELFPYLARCVDQLCFVHSAQTEGIAHGPATLFLHTGAIALVRPSMGAWILYGLGTENENLPGFITLNPPMNVGGPRNYGTAFLPASYQGTPLGRDTPGPNLLPNTQNPLYQRSVQQRHLQLVQALNAEQTRHGPTASELEAAIRSYEVAFRMQLEAPRLFDLSNEPDHTLKLYGIGQKPTDRFGRQCLIARRLVEAGVRFVQVNYSNDAMPPWDQHSRIEQHAIHARAVDQPIAALLIDLQRRGLLEETLVWWSGEFGRTPYAEKRGTGRDHNPVGFTMWFAGGGVRAGYHHGATDEYGFQAVQDPVHMRDVHATILYLLGLDHTRLTYTFAGRQFRLTDIGGRVVHELIA